MRCAVGTLAPARAAGMHMPLNRPKPNCGRKTVKTGAKKKLQKQLAWVWKNTIARFIIWNQTSERRQPASAPWSNNNGCHPYFCCSLLLLLFDSHKVFACGFFGSGGSLFQSKN